jgi:hypothetical protein
VALRTLDKGGEGLLGIETSIDIPSAKSVAALCAAWIVKQAEGVKSVASTYDLKIGAPSCVEAPAPVPFTAAAPYKSVRALKLNDGIRSGTDLVAETARGFFLLGARYKENDPTEPGCPSSYVSPTPQDDDGYRNALVRSALWAKDDGKTFITKLWNPQFHGGLAEKVQPFGPWKYVNGNQVTVPPTPWSNIPWKDVVNFRITQSGTLQVQP